MLQKNHEMGWQKKVDSRWTYTPKTNLAELLEYVVLPYHNDVPNPRGLDIFAQGPAVIGTEPRHIENQCIRMAVETENNAQNGMEPEYHSQEASDAYSLTAEPDLELRDFPS